MHLDVNYYWQEFLLYSPGVGFRWLVESDGHWNFVESVPPGEVAVHGKAATYKGRAFRLFQSSPAFVDQLSGEFYWKVQVGEEVASSDYVAPPQMLSREISTVADAKGLLPNHGEINWSLGRYVRRDEIAKAFNVAKLPVPTGVAPNQPFGAKAVYPVWAVLDCGGDCRLADPRIAATRRMCCSIRRIRSIHQRHRKRRERLLRAGSTCPLTERSTSASMRR